jgi:hypothetical protein
LVEALERSKLSDANPPTRSMMFEQHLGASGMGGAAPDYLIEKTTKALNWIADSLRQSGSRRSATDV